MSMKRIALYGELGRKFGKHWKLDVNSPYEAIRGISANCPDFERYLVESMESGVDYRVYVGHELMTPGEVERMGHPFSQREVIRIVPVVSGASGGLEAAIGVVLLFVPGMQAAGAMMILGGVMQMLSKPPTKNSSVPIGNTNPSFFFNGAENTVDQGGCVPVCYGGPILVGSQVISSGLFSEDF